MDTATSALRELATSTDTLLAELDRQYGAASAALANEHCWAHKLLGERQTGPGRYRTWPTTDQEAVTELERSLNAGELNTYKQGCARKVFTTIGELGERILSNRAEAGRLDDIWEANGGWSRFFLVDANNGHIHRDVSHRRCSRTPTTRHGWHPELSALTEADAVAALGPRLCTLCFPSAPLEWTLGPEKPPRCEGSGKSPVPGTANDPRRHSRYGECTGCHTNQTITSSGAIRAHKPATA